MAGLSAVAFRNCGSTMCPRYRVNFTKPEGTTVTLLTSGNKSSHGRDIKVAQRLAQDL